MGRLQKILRPIVPATGAWSSRRLRRGKKFLKGGAAARRAAAPIRRTLEGPAAAGMGSLPVCGCAVSINELK
jgi:hypothetical protein